MKTRKAILSVAALVAIALAVASMLVKNRPVILDKMSRESVVTPRVPDAGRGATNSSPVVCEETTAPKMELQARSLTPDADAIPSPQSRSPQSNSIGRPKREIQDPDAREALSFVGMDRDAEAYWIQAINNPDLPDDERKNLIEDLNEDGLSDPQNPAPEDMPLVLYRLRLIEALAPYAMDQVNFDAFMEAHKDLVNMINGVPVQ